MPGEGKRQLTLRLDAEVLDWFKAEGKGGYQTRINAVLRAFVEAQREGESGFFEPTMGGGCKGLVGSENPPYGLVCRTAAIPNIAAAIWGRMPRVQPKEAAMLAARPAPSPVASV